jgi:hypothetical protein
MALLAESVEPTASPRESRRQRPAGKRSNRSRRIKAIAAGVALVVISAGLGWLVPQLLAGRSAVSYVGQDASAVAEDLGCTNYKQTQGHDESVYKYRDRGTCLLGGTTVTITTFDDAAHGDAFLTLMRGLIPVLHPMWKGAATAAGEGWNVADTTSLSQQVAEEAVRRLGAGAVEVIPPAKSTGNE